MSLDPDIVGHVPLCLVSTPIILFDTRNILVLLYIGAVWCCAELINCVCFDQVAYFVYLFYVHFIVHESLLVKL